MTVYSLETYVTDTGREPFTEWLTGIKNKNAQSKIFARLRRVSFGNFGDAKPIKGAAGVSELREHLSPGYRVYYSIIGDKIVLLLAGSMKKDQARMIAKANKYLADYRARVEDDEDR